MPAKGAGTRTVRIRFVKMLTEKNSMNIETEVPELRGFAMARMYFGAGHERREAAAQGAVQTATFVVPWSPEAAALTERDMIETESGRWGIHAVQQMDGHASDIEITTTRRKDR